jgi:zinc transport system substrate-binding protein
MMRIKRLSKIILICLLLTLPFILSCQQSWETQQQDNKLRVVATIFPLYDFARNIGGDKVQVSLLLPPATDAHNMELKPNDIVKISKADLFLYVNMEMEHWAYKIIKATSSNTNMLPVETGNGITMLLLSETDESDQRSSKFDPHIWLDFDNAQKMVDNIAAAFIKRDARNGDFYRKNALEYKLRLAVLDKKYREGLTRCRTKVILHAGHWAFAYLANKYNFRYIAASTVSADSEPSPQKILDLIKQVKKQHILYIYYEDILAPRLAQTIAGETGAGLLKLYNGHGIIKEDLKEGTSFLMMMEKNLTNLKLGMQCP